MEYADKVKIGIFGDVSKNVNNYDKLKVFSNIPNMINPISQKVNASPLSKLEKIAKTKKLES